MRRYVENCNLYQRMENYIESLTEKLIANEILKKSTLNSQLYYQVATNSRKRCSSCSIWQTIKDNAFVVIMKETSVEGLVRLIKDNMWKPYGLPESMISDKGSQFIADLTRELTKC